MKISITGQDYSKGDTHLEFSVFSSLLKQSMAPDAYRTQVSRNSVAGLHSHGKILQPVFRTHHEMPMRHIDYCSPGTRYAGPVECAIRWSD